MRKTGLFAVAALMTLTACSSMSVQTDYAVEADFSQFETFRYQASDRSVATVAPLADERIVAVRGWIAEEEEVSGDRLRRHFDAIARGTCAEGARLDLSLQTVGARCLNCGEIYLPDHHVLICPACGSCEGVHEGEIGLGVVAIEVESA